MFQYQRFSSPKYTKPVLSTTSFGWLDFKRLFGSEPSFVVFAVLVVALLAIGLLRQPVASVGDLLQFDSGHTSLNGQTVTVPARMIPGFWAIPHRTCTLNTATMIKSNGSLIVTEIRRDGIAVLWTGDRTANGNADCGKNAQLLLTLHSYMQLLATQAPTR